MRRLFTILILILPLLQIYSRSSIGGVVNTYHEVQNVYSLYLVAAPTEDLSGLHPGDKILLVQMSGVEVYSGSGFQNSLQSYTQFLNAGRYYLLSVKSVNNTTKRVDFAVSIDATIFTSGQTIQMIKIYEDDFVDVNSTLTANAWNGKTGGVVALLVYKKLTLNADIDVSSKGFRGAVPENGFTGLCNNSSIYYYDSTVTGLAGKKGEGNVLNPWTYTKGPGCLVIGGGGGLGKFAGGGGGGNFGSGGGGGYQMVGCSQIAQAYGGVALSPGTNFYNLERIILGGGGGSSTWDGTHTATSGGSGGGIVLIITDTIQVSSGRKITSNGGGVSVSATAGGGGGGAGGSIFLDINYYKNPLPISLMGGKGGNTNTTSDTTGAGGGGGGGILRIPGSSLPSNITPTFTGGAGGVGRDAFHNGASGSNGGYFGNLSLPIFGFLFNSITGKDTLCAGQDASAIKGSTPKGGTTSYSYEWLISTDSLTWTNIGVNNIDYDPGNLNLTTWFRRVVISGGVRDTSLSEKIYVFPAISNNILDIRDTLCYNTSPGVLNGNAVAGGCGTYQYQWQSSINQSSWTNRSINSFLNESYLLVNTYYRRLVTSGIYTKAALCTSTSNIDTLTVLPLIGNNNLNKADTAICQNLDAGTVKTLNPTGGDNIYRYGWLSSANNITFNVIGGAVSSTYSPGILTADRYFKRVVYSGKGDVCRDTSTAFYVQVYPEINNNAISVDSSRYCAGNIQLQVNGLIPGGGNTPTYIYKWRSQTLHSNWSDISGAVSSDYSINGNYIDTFRIQRIIFSGRFNACKDTSIITQIDVIPLISNNLETRDTAICEGARPLSFIENEAGGGAGIGTYQYQWQDSTISSGWLAAPQDFSPNNQVNYSPKSLIQTTWYRRHVISQICASNSNPVLIQVYPSIENNIISGGPNQYVCFQSEKNLNAYLPTGGNNSYNYTWQQSPDNSTWTNAGSSQNISSSELSSPAYFRRIVRSGTYSQCIDTSLIVKININQLPTASITNIIDTVCENNNVQIIYSLTGNSPWTVKLGESGDTLFRQNSISAGSGMITFPVNRSAQIRILDVIDDSTCHATIKNGVYEVTVYSRPVPFAGYDNDTCGLNYKLQAVSSSAESSYWSWAGSNAAFENINNPTTVVTSDGYGEKTFTWHESNWECSASADVAITFFERPTSIDAGENQVLDYKFETNLNAQIPSVGTGYWSSYDAGSVVDDTLLNNTGIRLEGVGSYKFIWTVENGACEVLNDSVFITVGDLQIFSGFSPNGDEYNEEFILDLSGLNTAELIVLDINGGVVFSTTGKDQIKWDGKTNNGKDVPEGTYFYIIKEPGVSDRKGFIELRR